MKKNAPSKQNWKEGDICYYEFTPSTVEAVNSKSGAVRVVKTDGFFISGRNLKNEIVRPSLAVDTISKHFKEIYQNIFRYDFVSLNIPDIHSYLVHRWLKACFYLSLNTDYAKVQCDLILDEVNRFEVKFHMNIAKVMDMKVGPISMFKAR